MSFGDSLIALRICCSRKSVSKVSTIWLALQLGCINISWKYKAQNMMLSRIVFHKLWKCILIILSSLCFTSRKSNRELIQSLWTVPIYIYNIYNIYAQSFKYIPTKCTKITNAIPVESYSIKVNCILAKEWKLFAQTIVHVSSFTPRLSAGVLLQFLERASPPLSYIVKEACDK